MNRNTSSNKTIFQGNTIIESVNLRIDTLQPVKTWYHVLVQFVNNPEPRVQLLTNLFSVLCYSPIGSINLLLTSELGAISQRYCKILSQN